MEHNTEAHLEPRQISMMANLLLRIASQAIYLQSEFWSQSL